MTAPATREISLNDIGRKYMAALQRLSDLMVLTWTGAHCAQANVYDQAVQALPGLPNTEFRMSFQAVREEAERWWLHHSLREVLGLTVMFLDDIRKLCSLVEFNAARVTGTGNLGTLAAEVNAKVGRGDVASRISALKTRYNVFCPFETEIISLGVFASALHRGGIVDKDSVLKLSLRCVQPAGQSGPQAKLTNMQRSWGPGEKLLLTRDQHTAIFTTVSLFIGAMLTAVQDHAKRCGLPDTPPPVS